MKSILATFSVYGAAYLVLLAFVLGMLFASPKEELHLLLNSYHIGAEDTFFKYYSLLAEWPLYILALLPVFWRKFQLTVLFLLSEVSGGVVAQILKHLFSFDRPLRVFEHSGHALPPLVQGVELHSSNSFPSGHTSTFFVFFTCCALLLAYHYRRNRSGQLITRKRCLLWLAMLSLLVLAALGGYSRIYLSQHFLMDVCAGSVIGFVTPCLFFFLAWKWISRLCNRLHKPV